MAEPAVVVAPTADRVGLLRFVIQAMSEAMIKTYRERQLAAR